MDNGIPLKSIHSHLGLIINLQNQAIMKTLLIILSSIVSLNYLTSQNVGIGKPIPQEKLDVDGKVQSNGVILRDLLNNIRFNLDPSQGLFEMKTDNNHLKTILFPDSANTELIIKGNTFRSNITLDDDARFKFEFLDEKPIRVEAKTDTLAICALAQLNPLQFATAKLALLPLDPLPVQVEGNVKLEGQLTIPHPSPLTFPSNADIGWKGQIFNLEVGHPGQLDTSLISIDPVNGIVCIDGPLTKIKGVLMIDGPIVHSGQFISNGTIIGAAKYFRIDHPTDPNKYLQHSVIESNEMLNQYHGTITTGIDSLAIVNLPTYFDDINEDFRYQLTVVGSSFAQPIVFQEIVGNSFTIKTSKPSIKVSWQVTGRRKDAYALANPLVVELDK